MSKSFEFMCSLLRDGKYTVEIKAVRRKRTVSQNSLYWMWCQCIADSLYEMSDEKISKEDVHEVLRRRFLTTTRTFNGNTVTIPKSTTQLNTAEFTTYLEQIQAYMVTEYSIMLPLPQDKYYYEFIEQYSRR